MTSKESEAPLTELMVVADINGDSQKQDERYTVENINNVSNYNISSPSLAC